MEMIGPKIGHISAAICNKQHILLGGGGGGEVGLDIFYHALSKYLIASHNFSNSIFMTSSLYHSIAEKYFLEVR